MAPDDLALTATNVPANQSGIMHMGGGQDFALFGDGQRCVAAGVFTICHFDVQNAGAAGTLTRAGVVASGLTQGPACPIDPGETWNFQAWYRNPSGPCGGFLNLSHAVAVTFAP